MIHISVIPDDDDLKGERIREETIVLYPEWQYFVSFQTAPGSKKLDRVHGTAEKVARALRAAGYTVDVRYPVPTDNAQEPYQGLTAADPASRDTIWILHGDIKKGFPVE